MLATTIETARVPTASFDGTNACDGALDWVARRGEASTGEGVDWREAVAGEMASTGERRSAGEMASPGERPSPGQTQSLPAVRLPARRREPTRPLGARGQRHRPRKKGPARE